MGKKPASWTSKFLGWVIIAIIPMIIYTALTDKPGKTKSIAPGAGEKAVLSVSNSKDVLVAVNLQDYEESRKLIMAGDEQGLAQMIMALRLFSVDNNTPVLVIDRETSKRRIRIQEGPQKGLSGWVPDEYVK